MRVSEKKKIALVLSGGGLKAAAYHLGVCLALREKGFKFAGGSTKDVKLHYEDDKMTFKVYVGSSAGAVISTFLASGYSIDSIIDAFEKGSVSDLTQFIRRKKQFHSRLKPITYLDIFQLNGGHFLSVIPNVLRRQSLITGGIEALIKSGFKINGLFTAKGIERYLRKHVLSDNNFSALGVEHFIVGTQLNHSRKVVFGNFKESKKDKNIYYANFAKISDAVAASTSIPPVFSPYKIMNEKGEDFYFFDGEIRDTLSTHVAADHGADLVISSYSWQPYHYTKRHGSLHNFGIPVIVNQAIYQIVEQKIQKHIEHQQQISAIMHAVDGYFRQADLPAEHRDKLLDILSRRVNYKPDVDYIYIHPNPSDSDMFFVDHFSLNPEILARIVNIGFRSALQTLRKLDM
jgi:predicted acylesterase/phospholipase RssA